LKYGLWADAVQESYEIGSEHNHDQPNVWLPDEVLPGFRSYMTSFYWEMDSVANMLLRAIAIGIGMDDEDFFTRLHSGNNNQLRLLHYPPVPAANLKNGSIARMPAHSDWGSITMLFQDDCGGLQVGMHCGCIFSANAMEVEDPHQKGSFIAAPALKDAIVMNVGDLLQRWSNGR